MPRPPAKPSHFDLQQRTLETARRFLLGFPRELRDLIYANIFSYPGSHPIGLTYSHLAAFDSKLDQSHYLSARWIGQLLASETADAFYGLNNFVVPSTTPLTETLSFCRWGSGVIPAAFLRYLTIDLNEHVAFCCPNWSADDTRFRVVNDQHYEQVCLSDRRRAQFTCLLHIPRLERLHFRVQKSRNGPIELRDLNPVIYQLRQKLPQLNITLAVSFDKLLQDAWNSWDEITESTSMRMSRDSEQENHLGDWQSRGYPQNPDFQLAGYSECTELIMVPNEEDRKYVEEFLPDNAMPSSRVAEFGLLDQDVSTRRMLQACYACQEPALMRIQLESHWKSWQKWEKSESSL